MTGQLRQEVFERAAMTEKPAGLPHSWIWRERSNDFVPVHCVFQIGILMKTTFYTGNCRVSHLCEF
jgi:hypothetical protein